MTENIQRNRNLNLLMYDWIDVKDAKKDAVGKMVRTNGHNHTNLYSVLSATGIKIQIFKLAKYFYFYLKK